MSPRPGILITGAAKRVGAAMALYFARHGYDIALHYNSSEKDAQELKSQIEEQGVSCALVPHDLYDIAGIQGWMQRVRKAMPQVSALVNNASVFERASFMDTDEDLFDRQFTVNLKAPFFTAQAFAKTFGNGAVINVLDTDIATTQISHFAYLMSKKSLEDFTLMAAKALGPAIRVNGVCPGSMLPSDQNDTSYEEKLEKLVPMKSHPSLDELAEAVRWLTQQGHITGQVVYVDGGKHVL